MIREVVTYHAVPRRKGGSLWCGHAETDLVLDENGQVVCGPCSGLPTTILSDKLPPPESRS